MFKGQVELMKTVWIHAFGLLCALSSNLLENIIVTILFTITNELDDPSKCHAMTSESSFCQIWRITKKITIEIMTVSFLPLRYTI